VSGPEEWLRLPLPQLWLPLRHGTAPLDRDLFGPFTTIRAIAEVNIAFFIRPLEDIACNGGSGRGHSQHQSNSDC
jgi:hypothetical protein